MLKQNTFAITFLKKSPSLSQIVLIKCLTDNMLTTDIFNNSLKKGIITSNVSDHFPIFFSIQLTRLKLQEGVIKIKKEFLITIT